MIARLAWMSGIATLALLCAPLRARAQETAYRLEITTVGDSTVSISTEKHEWVREGQKGIAVDPMRHDALVARFVILHVDPVHKRALAIVTGQTTRLTTQYVALIARPGRKWYAQPTLWIGTVLGMVIGAVVSH
ncbi:MAG TPA: hypothetical protein VLI43_00650 [Gemmatimonadaceae bacterium]|nr:hypothetical protein [Gemmatimonadaceae bacterium]